MRCFYVRIGLSHLQDKPVLLFEFFGDPIRPRRHPCRQFVRSEILLEVVSVAVFQLVFDDHGAAVGLSSSGQNVQ